MSPRLFKAANRSPLWHLPAPEPVAPVEDYLAPSTIRVILPVTVAGQKCPVEPGDTSVWTDAERLVADNAQEVHSVEELRARVSQNMPLQILSHINLVVDNHGTPPEPSVYQI